MSSTMVAPENSVVLRRTYPATPERIFAAWTKPELLKVWFRPNERWNDPTAEIDLRVGGRFRIAMNHSDGSAVIAVGVYTVVDPPNRLVYSWQWESAEENQQEPAETLMTLELAPVADGTELTLKHERFSSSQQAEQHKEGWSAFLDALETYVSAK